MLPTWTSDADPVSVAVGVGSSTVAVGVITVTGASVVAAVGAAFAAATLANPATATMLPMMASLAGMLMDRSPLWAEFFMSQIPLLFFVS